MPSTPAAPSDDKEEIDRQLDNLSAERLQQLLGVLGGIQTELQQKLAHEKIAELAIEEQNAGRKIKPRQR